MPEKKLAFGRRRGPERVQRNALRGAEQMYVLWARESNRDLSQCRLPSVY